MTQSSSSSRLGLTDIEAAPAFLKNLINEILDNLLVLGADLPQ